MTQIIGLGAGGHAKVVLEILRNDPSFQFAGMLDANEQLWAKQFCGLPILGGDDQLQKLLKQGVDHAFIGVGTTGNTKPRQKLYELAKGMGFQFVSAIHSQAIISPSVRIGPGASIMAGAVINPEARLGDNVIINTRAVVEHDCVIGDHVHIATGALLAGGVSVGNGSHVGIGACVRQGIQIGRDAVIGAGAVVVDNVPDNVVVAGNPARKL